MNLPELGVRRPVTTAMLFTAIIILGFVSLSRLGIDLMPKIEIPTIGVITQYEGAGSQEVENRITELLEERLATVSDLDKIESTSQEGLSIVLLKFEWGTNLDVASNDVRDSLDIVKPYLPEDVDDPSIFKFDLSMMPVLIMGVTADESYPHLRKIIEDKVCTPLEAIPGVAAARVRGGLERQILVEIDRTRLEAYHLSINQIVGVLRAENISLPGGHLKIGRLDYILRTPEELEISEIEKIVVATRSGVPIYLKHIASVRDAFKEETEKVHIDRMPGIIMMVQKQSGANTVNVSRRVLQELEALGKELPPDVNLKVVMDFSEFITLSIKNLRNTVFFGGIFVFLVILFFLRNLRGSIIVASSIPICLIITFVLMFAGDFTINILSLSSLAIAIGMVVDAAIVVYENIHRHTELGERASEAAVIGASEVGTPIVAAVLCMVSVFIPLVFVGGMTGVLMRELAFTISLALLASLFTALTLIPMLSSKLLRARRESEVSNPTSRKIPLSRFYIQSEKWFKGLENRYRLLLGWALSHRRLVISGGFVILALSFAMVKFVSTEFMPAMERGMLTFNVELPVGERFEETGKVVKTMDEIIAKHVPEMETCFSRWGYAERGIESLMGGEQGSNIGMSMTKIVTKSERKRSEREIALDLKSKFSSFPGAEVRFSAEDPMEGLMFGGGKPLTIEIRGYDLGTARNFSRQVAEVIKGIRGVSDVEISRREGKPELQIIVDRDRASSLGLNVANIATAIETYFKGKVATQYREGGDEYDILVRLREEDRQHIKDVENVFVTSPLGKQIGLSNIAEIRRQVGPVKIERKGQERIVKVSGEIYGRDLGSVVREAKEKLSRLTIPPGFTFGFGGAREEQEKSFRLLFLALILGIILVYMVMASQFESIRDPFIILSAIPFSMIGVIWALIITGYTLSVISFIGLIMLTGIAVETGIVLISYINILRRRGMETREAIMEGGRVRFRPVLMAAITTILGLTPLALARGEGAEMWSPLAITVIGGLLVSTVVTLIFIPTLYSVFEERVKRKLSRQKMRRNS